LPIDAEQESALFGRPGGGHYTCGSAVTILALAPRSSPPDGTAVQATCRHVPEPEPRAQAIEID
jgi:hypothetical protein